MTRIIIAAVVLMCIAVAVYKLGGQGQREGILQDEIQTIERTQNADDPDRSLDAIRDRLRNHAKQ